MSEKWIICPDCGFGCVESQLSKTKGFCPRCNRTESDAYHKRRKDFETGVVKAK